MTVRMYLFASCFPSSLRITSPPHFPPANTQFKYNLLWENIPDLPLPQLGFTAPPFLPILTGYVTCIWNLSVFLPEGRGLVWFMMTFPLPSTGPGKDSAFSRGWQNERGCSGCRFIPLQVKASCSPCTRNRTLFSDQASARNLLWSVLPLNG